MGPFETKKLLTTSYVITLRQTGNPLATKTSALHRIVMMASEYVQDNSLIPNRKLLVDLSLDLSKKEVETLKLAGVDFIPRRITENIATGLQFFDVLEQDGRIGPRNLDLLQDMLKTLGRVDLARKIQAFLSTSVKGQTDGKMRSLNSISVNHKTKIL